MAEEKKLIPSKEAAVVEEEGLVLYYVKVDVISAKNVINADFGGKSDPFCEVLVNSLQRTTHVIQDNLNPVWNCQYAFFVQEKPNEIFFKLWDEDDYGKNDYLGDTKLNLLPLWESATDKGSSFEGDLDIKLKNKPAGTLQIKAFVRVMQPVKTEKKLVQTAEELTLTSKNLESKVVEVKETKEKLDVVAGDLSVTKDTLGKTSEQLGKTKEELAKTEEEKAKIAQELKDKYEKMMALKAQLESNKNDEDYLILYFVHLDVIKGNDLRNADIIGKSDPFVEAVVNGLTRATHVIQDNLNPVWNSKFAYFVQNQPKVIDFHLYDEDDHGKNDSLGDAKLELKDLFETGKTFEGDLPVIFKGKQKGSITVRCQCRVMHPVQTEKKLVETEGQLALTTEEKKKVEAQLNAKESELESKYKEVSALAQGNSEAQKKLDDLFRQFAEAEVKVKTQSEELARLKKENEDLKAASAKAAAAPAAEAKKEGKEAKEEKKDAPAPSEQDFKNQEEKSSATEGKYLVRVHVKEAKGLRKPFLLGDVDPYVQVHFDEASEVRVSKTRKGVDPKFDEQILHYSEQKVNKLSIQLLDESRFAKAATIGAYSLDLAPIWGGKPFEGEVELQYNNQPAGKLTLRVSANHLPPAFAQ